MVLAPQEHGRRARHCTCEPENVRIDVNEFAARLAAAGKSMYCIVAVQIVHDSRVTGVSQHNLILNHNNNTRTR